MNLSLPIDITICVWPISKEYIYLHHIYTFSLLSYFYDNEDVRYKSESLNIVWTTLYVHMVYMTHIYFIQL